MKLVNLWIDHPIIDWIVTAIACGVAWWVGYLDLLPTQDRASLYQTLVSVAVAVLGLGAVTVTFIVTGTPTNKLQSAIEESGRGLVSLMFSCLFGCLLSAILYTGLYFVAAGQELLAGLLFGVASGLLVLRSIRLIWLLRNVLNLLV